MDPFVGEIRLWALNFAPVGWAFCQGQLLAISSNTALFSLLGTQFGGDGRSTFGLPNLQGQVTVGMGQGSGLSQYFIGESGGTPNITLNNQQMPAHPHTLPTSGDGTASIPASTTATVLAALPAARGKGATPLYASQSQYQSGPLTMNVAEAGITGGNQPHNNMAPYLVLNYCIALQGVFPQRQ